MPALTRAEAEERARLLAVHRYTLLLELTEEDREFFSRTEIRLTAREAADTFVELKPTTLHKVFLDGHALDPATLTDGRLPLTLTEGEHHLVVEADFPYSRTGEGLHRFTDPADGETYVHSQAFLDQAQRIFACFDQPDLKAVFEVQVAAPPGWTVLANSVGGEACDGIWEFEPTPPLPTYLFAVAAGPWHSVRTEHAGLPFGLHCRRSLAPHLDAEELFAVTRHSFDAYAGLFAEPYPFDSYDQIFVPEFNSGAMENPGLIAYKEGFLFRSEPTPYERGYRAKTIAHEMAHMWFGDLVTMRWWDDLWLNESFADHMAYEVSGARTEFAVHRKVWGYDADQRPSTHPVAPAAVHDTAEALLNFDGISYAKGASALRQLAVWLGESTFRAGVDAHLSRHRFGNATLADFIDALTEVSGRDVGAWAEAWLRTTGTDTLTVAYEDEDTAVVRRSGGERPHRLALGVYEYNSTGLVLRERILTEPGTRHTLGRSALLLPNDGDLTYAKLRLDPDSWTAVTASLSTIEDPVSRAVLWTTARDLVRDGELPPTAYLDLVRAHLPGETDPVITESVLAFARATVVDRYTAPGTRLAALATVADTCRGLLGTAAHAAALRTLLDSVPAAEIPDVPETDLELRWRALLRRCVLDAAGEKEIAALESVDRTAAGREGAARCRAALPDLAAKGTAWRTQFSHELPVPLIRAVGQGFWQPEHAGMTREFAHAWYESAVPQAARRGAAVAGALGRHAFPAVTGDAFVLAEGERHLRRDTGLHPSLHRSLLDQLDDLRRALRVASHVTLH